MEGRGPSHSPAPLPLGQRQLPFPFILPENLGPLPSPERRPLVPLGETGAARRLSLPSEEPHHLAYLWQASSRAGPEDPRAGTTTRRDSSLKSLMSKLGRPRSLQPSELPILPPPLPTSPQQPGSPACRQTSSQVALLNNRIEIPPASLWPRTVSPGQKESPHYHKHPSPETPPHNGQISPVAVRYNCDQCPESFLTNGALKRHRRVHLERNFHCPCGAAYTDMSVLRKHQNLKACHRHLVTPNPLTTPMHKIMVADELNGSQFMQPRSWSASPRQRHRSRSTRSTESSYVNNSSIDMYHK